MSRDEAGDAEQDARIAGLAADTTETDASDIPEASPGAWAAAETGRFHRPGNEAVTNWLDMDVPG